MTSPDDKTRATLQCRRIYWQAGQPRGSRFVAEVNDPPCGGWQSALVLEVEDDISIFCPYSMRHFLVSRKSQEFATSIPDDLRKQWFIELMKRKWAMHEKLKLPADFEMASYFMIALGGTPPEIIRDPEMEQKGVGGKPAANKLIKYIKDGTKKSDIFKFFWEPGRTVGAAEAEFKTTRSNILSHLFCLNRDHGVGYELRGDTVKLLLTIDGEFPITKEEKENATT